VGSGEAEGARWLAVPSIGPALSGSWISGAAASRTDTLALTSAAVATLSALASAGAVLPDARLQRFEVDAGGHPWLVDVRRLTTAPNQMPRRSCSARRDLVRRVLEGARRFVPPPGLPEDLPAIASFAELGHRLARAW
jgi:hypothetical protein